MMTPKNALLVVGAALSLGGFALAQDSVSRLGTSLPGDAVDPWNTSEQLNTYVVDLTRFRTSWNTQFGIAPIAKTSRGNVDPTQTFANNGLGGQTMSSSVLRNQAYPFASYSVWDAAGAGVNNNTAINDAPGVAVPTGTSSQFAFAFDEFGTADGTLGLFHDGIVTGLVNFDPKKPDRLYVARINSAINGDSPAEETAAMSLGAVDAFGNTHIRADGFGALGPNPVANNIIFRVRPQARSFGLRNKIDNAGSTDFIATDIVSLPSPLDTHNPPSIVGADLTGGSPVMVATNFLGEYVHEASFGLMSASTEHRIGSTDHRGNIAVSKSTIFPDSVATGGILGKDAFDNTRALLVWGLDSDGSALGNVVLTVPNSITDNDDLHVSNTIGESVWYRSQVAFQGGNGQVGINTDQAGRHIVATAWDSSGTDPASADPSEDDNAIIVARLNAAGTLQGWTTAGWVDGGGGKEILNGPGGLAIGRMTQLGNVTGGTVLGPSVSCPFVDSVGNVWFQAGVELFNRIDTNMDGTPDASDFDTALLRAVYDPATFSYQLELVLELGRTFFGQNSNRRWQIQFMGIADNNSVASNTLWSGNGVQCAFNGGGTQNLKTRSSRSLGGLVVNCTIVYDKNQDGSFDDMLGAGVDERYSALIYIGHVQGPRAGFRNPNTLGDGGTITVGN